MKINTPIRQTIILSTLAFLSLTLYLSTMLHVYPSGIPVTSGDAAIYAQSIKTGELNLNHIGYLITGNILYSALKNTFTLIDIVTFISVLFGSLSLIFCYLISRKLLKNSKDAMQSTLIVMFAGTYWLYSIAIEIYTMQLFFLWGSLYFMMDKKTHHSMLLLFTGLFISLTSVFFIPVLAYLAYKNKNIKIFTCELFISAILYLILSYKQIFYVIQGGSTGLHLVAPLANLYYATQSFLFFLPLAVIGTYYLYKKDKEKTKFISIACLPYTYFLFFNWDHGVFLLPIYVFISSLAIYATRQIPTLRNRQLITLAFISFFIFELSFVIQPITKESITFDRFIKSTTDITDNSTIYMRYDYGEIYRITLMSDYKSFQKPYSEFKSELEQHSNKSQILVMDLETSRIDSRNIKDYHPNLLSDYKLKIITCSSTFNIHTIWLGLRENRYCIYEIR